MEEIDIDLKKGPFRSFKGLLKAGKNSAKKCPLGVTYLPNLIKIKLFPILRVSEKMVSRHLLLIMGHGGGLQVYLTNPKVVETISNSASAYNLYSKQIPNYVIGTKYVWSVLGACKHREFEAPPSLFFT